MCEDTWLRVFGAQDDGQLRPKLPLDLDRDLNLDRDLDLDLDLSLNNAPAPRACKQRAGE